MRTEAKAWQAERGFAFGIDVARRPASAPDTGMTEIYHYHAEPRLIREWLAEDARPFLDAYAEFAEGVTKRVVDGLGEDWVDSLVTPRDGRPADTSSLKSVFTGLRPIDPPLSTDHVGASVVSRGKQWAEVDSLTPRLRWETFPQWSSARHVVSAFSRPAGVT